MGGLILLLTCHDIPNPLFLYQTSIFRKVELMQLKFVFSKKATKFDEIFTADLTGQNVVSVKSMVKIVPNFVAF